MWVLYLLYSDVTRLRHVCGRTTTTTVVSATAERPLTDVYVDNDKSRLLSCCVVDVRVHLHTDIREKGKERERERGREVIRGRAYQDKGATDRRRGPMRMPYVKAHW